MIQHINQTQQKHILTLENPIEFLHRDISSAITQREVGVDTESVRLGLRAAMRQDPDVVMLAEMRDAETADIALKVAETGRVVISALHTIDAVTTIGRLVAMFPADDQEIARLRLSEALQAVVSQRLLPRADGQGRAAAVEVLICTGTVREMIRGGRTGEIHGYIRTSREQYGMQTFDQHLLDLVGAGTVTPEAALAASTHPSEFELQVRTMRHRPPAADGSAKLQTTKTKS
jgi:twitching motility protein PilT